MTNRVSAALVQLPHKPHALYRFFDRTDVLLYVGITADLPTRLKNHRREKPWWVHVHHITVDQFDTRQDALDAEAEAIRTEGPLHNDQHNDMAVAPAAESSGAGGPDDEALQLADVILRDLTAVEREVVLSDNRTDFEGNDLPEHRQRIAAAYSAVMDVMWDRGRIRDRLNEMLDFLPDGRGDIYRMDARREQLDCCGADAYVSASDTMIGALERFTADIATSHLARLDSYEAAEWRACAENIGGTHGHHAELWAARYAAWWKSDGWVPRDACHGPGKNGARCPRKVGARVWYEVCPKCDYGRRACDGHLIWCLAHTEAAAAGRLELFDAIPFMCFPVRRFEEIQPEELEPPF